MQSLTEEDDPTARNSCGNRGAHNMITYSTLRLERGEGRVLTRIASCP